MNDRTNNDWWLWQMYRQVATYIHQPTAANESRLRQLMEAYRKDPAARQAQRLNASPLQHCCQGKP